MILNLWSVALGYYGLAIVSAVLPWVNAELLMMSAVPVAGSRGALAVLVTAVSAGQMTGKAIMYWASRKSTGRRSPLVQGAIDRWRARLQQRPRSVLVVTFLSALVGFPPFFIVSVVAGALGVSFPRFLAIGAVGRLMHFTIVAYLPDLIWRTL
ncbi:MAG TPA: VTT domain-containing protein [Vicinamibacterales bacterium]